MFSELYNQLNEEQTKAVKIIEGPVLVLAGAGSGKTRVVTYRIIHMIESGISPTFILGLTFTNKAAGEMKERVHSLTNHNVLISTFHSLGAKILRESIHHLGYERNFTIYDEEDVNKILKECFLEIHPQEKKNDLKNYRGFISQMKNNLLDPEETTSMWFKGKQLPFIEKVYRTYQTKLQDYNAVDFDDLLLLPVKLFRYHPNVLEMYQERWPFLLIDEYQDTNEAQYRMVHYLVKKSQNLFVVGDPDQSIYSWRGANVYNILHYEKEYPNAVVIRLEQNYRSKSNILEAANALISGNISRYEKKLWSERGPGEKIKLLYAASEREEAEFVAERIRYFHETQQIPLKEIAVFYRTNAQSRIFEDQFLIRRIPYVIIGGISFYQRKEVKDILAFLRMVQSGNDYVSFMRTINIPRRGLGAMTLEKIRVGANQSGLSIMGYLEKIMQNALPKGSFRPTTKQVAGMQDYVILIRELREISKTCSIKTLVQKAIEQSKYLDYLKVDPESYEERKQNLDALITKASEWENGAINPSLSDFLEELSLRSTLDEADPTIDRAHLMTIHNGKGLEFTLTFIVGLEENLFPHINSLDDPQALEEERRLCYVGITRAKDYLFLSCSQNRMLWGTWRKQDPSRFLSELPHSNLEMVKSRFPFEKQTTEEEINIYEEPFSDEVSVTPPEPEKNRKQYAPGDVVFHREFGVGVVGSANPSGPLGLTYKIFFSKDQKERTIVGKYAFLTKL